ncbi:MAG: PIN domain-containing protein [Spirochaetaceae bacterium]|nr:PIN domain-containing protein [Spirochaetaceae bacterium]MDT8299539.1 PIN domain-containing protein [Spirochaetaceae bacterium]
MSDKTFVDTNILVYARDAGDPQKHQIAKSLMEDLWKSGLGRISTQVCGEYFVTVTGKLSRPMTSQAAWEDIEDLAAWKPVAVDMGILRVARHVQNRYGLGWWDSAVVAAASHEGCSTILTEDLNAGQDYLGVKAVNPFA